VIAGDVCLKYGAKRSALRVALIKISLSSGLDGKRSRRQIKRKSSLMPRSCTSSTTTEDEEEDNDDDDGDDDEREED
jgi:hypothetical protein